jgi:UDP-N-acetylglucosamine 4-epimerase
MNVETLDHYLQSIAKTRRVWLVSGAAGFIGANVVDALLLAGQSVIGLDNFATGQRANIDRTLRKAANSYAGNFTFIEGNITDPVLCKQAVEGVEIVLHQAGLGSVPRSIADPMASTHANVLGYVTLLTAAKDAGVRRFVYASSSSVYGDNNDHPKYESRTGKPLSPYAATKAADELFGLSFSNCFDVEPVGLRYFNVFGRWQDPHGPYAAVLPLWFKAIYNGEPTFINGDGETSRDFCHISNVIYANLLAGTADSPDLSGEAFNIACGESHSLNELFFLIRDEVALRKPSAATAEPAYRDFRPGDIQHSLADISKAGKLLGYHPLIRLKEGVAEVADYYFDLFH